MIFLSLCYIICIWIDSRFQLRFDEVGVEYTWGNCGIGEDRV